MLDQIDVNDNITTPMRCDNWLFVTDLRGSNIVINVNNVLCITGDDTANINVKDYGTIKCIHSFEEIIGLIL